MEVNKAERSVRVFGTDEKLIAFYPASIGSTEKPAPSGKFVVRSVKLNPSYHYSPKYAFQGQKATEPVTVPPGPNNQVGLVWIGLSAESYGIHGKPQAAEREQNRIAWLHSAYQLRCVRPRQTGPQGHSRRVY